MEQQTDRVGFLDTGEPLPSDQVVQWIKENNPTDTVLLAFSLGKDSLGAWLKLRDHFTVLPYHTYRIPDMEFINDQIRYYEDFFDTRIIVLPNPDFYYMIADLVWQTPGRARVCQAARLPNFTYAHIEQWIKEDYGLPQETWTATGVRSNDNMIRRMAMKRHGPINLNAHKFHAVWDWNIQKLHDEILAAVVRISVEYLMYGHSIGGLDYRFIKPILDHYPEDFQKILEWFPLAEAEIVRYELQEEYEQWLNKQN